MTTRYQYQFPEKSAFRAMEACSPGFDISRIPDWEHVLHADLSANRFGSGQTVFDKMMGQLGFWDSDTFSQPGSFCKILFSGHPGCGKSTELERFAEDLRSRGKHCVVFIPLEKLTDISTLDANDLYFLCITELMRTLRGMRQEWFAHLPEELLKPFEHIAQRFFQDEEIVKEISSAHASDAGVQVGLKVGTEAGNFSFWSLLKEFIGVSAEAEAHGKYTYSRNAALTRRIRERVRDQLSERISDLNLALLQLSQHLEQQGLPAEIVFLIDGFEKTRYEVYEHLFLRDQRFVTELNTHMICCVPIKTFYEIQSQPVASMFSTHYLPMLKDTAENQGLLTGMVLKRADPGLFQPEALHYMATFAGGSPRQMLKLVTNALQEARNEIVSTEHARRAVTQYGVELQRKITQQDRKIILSRQYNGSDVALLQLIYGTVLLEYNGDRIERRLNPVLNPYFPAT